MGTPRAKICAFLMHICIFHVVNVCSNLFETIFAHMVGLETRKKGRVKKNSSGLWPEVFIPRPGVNSWGGVNSRGGGAWYAHLKAQRKIRTANFEICKNGKFSTFSAPAAPIPPPGPLDWNPWVV